MDRHGRRVAVLAHAVHVRRVEVERLAGAVAQLARRAAEHEALLDDLALDHRDRAARDVVVVEAGVVAVRPGDHPDVDVVVAPELLEVALRACRGAPAPRHAPARRRCGRPARAARRGRGRAHAGDLHARRRRRAAARDCARAARRRTASPSDSSRGATTGRSEPWTSWSTPISRTTASTARVAVGGDVEEDAGVAAGAAAAGREPLAVQRRQAGEHREAHAQARVRGPAPDGNAYQAVCIARDVARQRAATSGGASVRRRPAPARDGRAAARRGARALEHRAEALVAGRVAERVGGHARAREAVVEQRRRAPPGRARRGRPRPRRRTARAARRRPRGRRRAAARPRRRAAPRSRAGPTGRSARGRSRRRPRAPRGGPGRDRRGRRAPRPRRPGAAPSRGRCAASIGGSRRRASARSSGSGQRCWWMSIESAQRAEM